MNNPSPHPEDLLDDLILMRKGAGFTSTRMHNAGFLAQVLGSESDSFQIVQSRFTSAITSLHEPEANLLLAVYALLPETEKLLTLKARREWYGKQINRKVDTIMHRETAALKSLRNQLLTGWYPQSPVSRRVPELHNGFVNEYVKVTTVINDTCWQESRHHYRMLALFDEADYFAFDTSYPGAAHTYGEFKSRTRKLARGWQHQFYLANGDCLKRGELYNLKFKLTPDTAAGRDYTAPKTLVEESLAFHERTLRAIFELVFIGDIPTTIWRFSGLGHNERPGLPTRDNLLKVTNLTGRVEFHDLFGGLYAGVAWEW